MIINCQKLAIKRRKKKMFFVKKEEKEEEEGNKSTRETRSSARAKWVLQNLHLYDLPSNSTTNSLPISSSSSLLLFTIYPPLQIAKPVNFLERGRERDNENGNGLALASGEQCTATYAFAW
jgi:hypothetical protein